ncbi:MAG: serine/threonine protein kinase [Polyangiaceae bacterium]|nr:serine/threonine protein kinase [Polyangiaceae bacterium]
MGAFDDYEQGSLIGTGGFADVYRATHIPSRNTVALKISRQGNEALGRIRREIDVQRKLSHANIMRLLDWDRESFTWFATEVAEGNLGEVHERTKLSEHDVARFLEEVLAGLGAAHRRGYVHRDLSPGNILRTRGQWVVADWGYVTDPDASKIGRLTRTGTSGGTFTWASPEMLQDAHCADARSDLYSLGKLAAWLLTGTAPGIGSGPELPKREEWRTYLGRLTEKDLDERFQSAEEALTGLAEVVRALPSPDTIDEGNGLLLGNQAADPVTASVGALKRYLTSPEHRIRLSDLITKVTKETIAQITADRFNPKRLDQGDAYLDRLQAYFECCRPLMHLLFTGCYYGDVAQEKLWTTSVERVANNYVRSGYGHKEMIQLQQVPGMLVMNAAAFGAILGNHYGNLAAVTVRPVFRGDSQENIPFIRRFGINSVMDLNMLRNTKRFEDSKLPRSELMFEFLRELGRDDRVSDTEYEGNFDRFEIILALITFDSGQRTTGSFALRNRGMGSNGEYGPIADLRKEFEKEGKAWGPIAAGLFDRDVDRVRTAFKSVTEIADQIAEQWH